MGSHFERDLLGGKRHSSQNYFTPDLLNNFGFVTLKKIRGRLTNTVEIKLNKYCFLIKSRTEMGGQLETAGIRKPRKAQ